MDMRLDEVAAFIGKSVAQTRRYMESGLLTPHKAGKHLLFDRAQVVAFAQARGLRIDEQAITGPVEMTPERAEIVAATIEGYTEKYRRDKMSPLEYVQKVHLAASGTLLKVG